MGELLACEQEEARLTTLEDNKRVAKEAADDAKNAASATLTAAQEHLDVETVRIDDERATLERILVLLDTLLPASSKVRIGSDGVRAEILYNGEWGTICDDDFDDQDAIAFCSTLNGSPMPLSTAVGSANTVDGSGPINADDLLCNGESNIFDCAGTWGSHNCGHHEDVGVHCAA